MGEALSRRPLWLRVEWSDRSRTFPIPANWTLEEAAYLAEETALEEEADVRLMMGTEQPGQPACVCRFPPR